MKETITTDPGELENFFKKIGYSVPKGEIVKIFPGYFPDRRVFCLKADKEERVIKLRPASEAAEKELAHMRKLEVSYSMSHLRLRGSNGAVIANSKYFVLDMPYLGCSLGELAEKLDMNDQGVQTDFNGFSTKEIDNLVNAFERDHFNFTRLYGLIHGDITPNNILWNSTANRLVLIDGEALSPCDDEKRITFSSKLSDVREWIFYNLQKG